MRIDEKKLREFESYGQILIIRYRLTKEDWSDPLPDDPEAFKREVVRLARIGIWAETHGIPSFRKIARDAREQCDQCDKGIESAVCTCFNTAPFWEVADQALAALPEIQK